MLCTRLESEDLSADYADSELVAMVRRNPRRLLHSFALVRESLAERLDTQNHTKYALALLPNH